MQSLYSQCFPVSDGECTYPVDVCRLRSPLRRALRLCVSTQVFEDRLLRFGHHSPPSSGPAQKKKRSATSQRNAVERRCTAIQFIDIALTSSYLARWLTSSRPSAAHSENRHDRDARRFLPVWSPACSLIVATLIGSGSSPAASNSTRQISLPSC